MMTADQALQEFQPMIHKHVWWTLRRIGDYSAREEVLAEAYWVFCEAWNSFNSDLASFSTWLHIQLSGWLRHWIKVRWRTENRDGGEPSEDMPDGMDPEDRLRFMEYLDHKLSPDAKTLAFRSMRVGRRLTTKDLGWEKERYTLARKEVKAALSAVAR